MKIKIRLSDGKNSYEVEDITGREIIKPNKDGSLMATLETDQVTSQTLREFAIREFNALIKDAIISNYDPNELAINKIGKPIKTIDGYHMTNGEKALILSKKGKMPWKYTEKELIALKEKKQKKFIDKTTPWKEVKDKPKSVPKKKKPTKKPKKPKLLETKEL